MLAEDSIVQKLDVINNFNNLLTPENPSHQQSMEIIISCPVEIVTTMKLLLKFTLSNKRQLGAANIKIFLDFMLKMVQIKPLVQQIPFEVLNSFIDILLLSLITEDESKQETQSMNISANDTIIKPLNSTVLRLLENSNQNYIFHILMINLYTY